MSANAIRHVIDLMPAHAPKYKTEAAYNRAQQMMRRLELAQAWADMLMGGAAEVDERVVGRRR
jgi:hypothetical protein